MRTFVLILCLLSQSKLIADWTQTNGIQGGAVGEMFSVGEKVFAATDFGTMYFSNDNGQSYTIRTSGIKGVYINSFASINNTVFAASTDSGVYRTTNDGLNWIKSNTGLDNIHVTSLAVNGSILCAATFDRFYTSSNYGISWTEPDNDFTLGIIALTVTNNVIFAAISQYTMIFRSSNNGISWDTSLNDVKRNVYLRTIDSKNSEIYTSGSINDFYRSTDFGVSWSYVYNAPGFIHSIKILDNKILAASLGGLYNSTNNGETWNLDSNGIPAYADCRSITVSGQNIYVGIGSERYPGCIYKSTDQGSIWNPSSSDIIATRIKLFYKIDNKIYTSAYNKGLFYTTDHGDNWINANTDLPNNGISNITSMGNCQSNYLLLSDRNYISTNSGQNWQIFGGSSTPHFYNFVTKNDTILALKGYPWKSTDRGLSWFASNNGYNAGNHGFGLCTTDQFTYSAASTSIQTGSLFRSSDFGNSWIRTLYTTSGFRLTCLAATGNHVILGYTASDSGIITSTDYGETFTMTNNGLASRKVNTLYIASNKIFAATTNGIFYKQIDENIWYPINNSSFDLNVDCFISDSLYLYAGTIGNGIWRRPLNEIITNTNENNMYGEDFSLSQNYPNPFNPVTKINFTLKNSSLVKITILDISGKVIETLVDGYTSEGNHSLAFDGTNLSSGIYFCKMTSGNFNDILKMILIK